MKDMLRAETQYIVQYMGMKSVKYGGLERFIISLSKTLRQHNIRLIVVYFNQPSSELFLKHIEENKIILFSSDPKAPLDVFKTLLKIKRKYKPLLYHSHFQPFIPCTIAKLLACPERLVSLRTMIHTQDHIEVDRLSQVPLKTKFLRKMINVSATRLLAVSNAVKNQYQNLFPEISNKIKTFYMGADQNFFDKEEIRKELNFSPETVYVCTTAFASPMKGLDQLLESLRILKDEFSNDVKYCLIGLDETGQFTIDLKLKAKEYGILDLIIFMGIVDNVPQLLKAMDIYVQPSRTEAISMTLMEAAMAELPLIGTNVGGIPEIIINDQTGFLFELGDTKQLADCLDLLIKNPKLRTRLGNGALNHALKNFNRDTQISTMTELYLSLLHK